MSQATALNARECAEAHSYLKGVVDDERFYIQCTTGYYFWKRQFKRLPELLEKSGSKKMLLISGPVLKKIGMVEKVEEIVKASGIEVEVFTDVEANPSVATVDKATEAYKKQEQPVL